MRRTKSTTIYFVIQRTCTSILFLLFTIAAGCASQKADNAASNEEQFPVGMWVNEHGKEYSLFDFKSDGTGCLIAVGSGTAIGSRFKYSIADNTIRMTLVENDKEIGELTLHFDDSRLALKDVTGVASYHRTDDPNYRRAIDSASDQD